MSKLQRLGRAMKIVSGSDEFCPLCDNVELDFIELQRKGLAETETDEYLQCPTCRVCYNQFLEEIMW